MRFQKRRNQLLNTRGCQRSMRSEKILAASVEHTRDSEMIRVSPRIGGNATLLANALAQFEMPVRYIGCLGFARTFIPYLLSLQGA